MNFVFGVLTGVAWIYAYYLYIKTVLEKRSTPSLGFWLTMAAVDWVALTSLIASGVHGTNLLQILIWTIGSTTTMGIIVWYNRTIQLDRIEWTCISLAIVGTVLWHVINNPRITVALQVTALIIGSLPFWRNALTGRERWQTIIPMLVGSIFSLGTVSLWSFLTWPAWIMPILGLTLNCISIVCALNGRSQYALRHSV